MPLGKSLWGNEQEWNTRVSKKMQRAGRRGKCNLSFGCINRLAGNKYSVLCEGEISKVVEPQGEWELIEMNMDIGAIVCCADKKVARAFLIRTTEASEAGAFTPQPMGFTWPMKGRMWRASPNQGATRFSIKDMSSG